MHWTSDAEYWQIKVGCTEGPGVLKRGGQGCSEGAAGGVEKGGVSIDAYRVTSNSTGTRPKVEFPIQGCTFTAVFSALRLQMFDCECHRHRFFSASIPTKTSVARKNWTLIISVQRTSLHNVCVFFGCCFFPCNSVFQKQRQVVPMSGIDRRTDRKVQTWW